MTLPSSGPISLADVNIELQRSSTTNISLNDSLVRSLAGIPASGSTISMANLLGKSYEVARDYSGSWQYYSDNGFTQFQIRLYSGQYNYIFSNLSMTGAELIGTATVNQIYNSNNDGLGFFSYDGSALKTVNSFTTNPNLARLEYYGNGSLIMTYQASTGFTLSYGSIFGSPTTRTNYLGGQVGVVPGVLRVITRG